MSNMRSLPAAALLLLVPIAARCEQMADAPRPSAQVSLSDAFATIRAHRKVDLTHTFSPSTPVWHGFGPAHFSPAVGPKTLEPYTIAHDGFRATYYAMVGQYGTHVDPPAHFDALGKTLDDISLEKMILPLVVLDDTPYLAADPNHAFSEPDLAAWEKKHGRIPGGAFVALRTDMSKDWNDPERFMRQPFPAWSLEVLKILFEQRGAIAIGHESLDTDSSKNLMGERYVLESGHYQIEALTNLDKVPPTGAYVIATWPKPKGSLGFPARVIAVVP